MEDVEDNSQDMPNFDSENYKFEVKAKQTIQGWFILFWKRILGLIYFIHSVSDKLSIYFFLYPNHNKLP